MNVELKLPSPRIGPRSYAHELLVLGESYYLESGVAEISPDTWYSNGIGMLDENDRTYLNYDDIFRINKLPDGRWKSRGCTIYRNIEQALVDAGMQRIHNMLDHCTIGNCFLRPAFNGSSLRVHPEDVTRASRHLVEWTSKHDVKLVICASSLSYHTVVKQLALPCRVVPVSHPSSAWWHRAGGRYGRAKFVASIREFAQAGGAPAAFAASHA